MVSLLLTPLLRTVDGILVLSDAKHADARITMHSANGHSAFKTVTRSQDSPPVISVFRQIVHLIRRRDASTACRAAAVAFIAPTHKVLPGFDRFITHVCGYICTLPARGECQGIT